MQESLARAADSATPVEGASVSDSTESRAGASWPRALFRPACPRPLRQWIPHINFMRPALLDFSEAHMLDALQARRPQSSEVGIPILERLS
jgi:hypothetical protein